MVEIKEVLRRWKSGVKKKRIAAQTTVDVKTVRRYIGAAEDCGPVPGPELFDASPLPWTRLRQLGGWSSGGRFEQAEVHRS